MFVIDLMRAWLYAILLTPYHYLRNLIYTTNSPNTLQAPKATMPKFYHDDEAWADIEPLPQDDGSLHPLAAIAYTAEYSEAMGYLRAVMANNEFSDRVLGLTEHIISMNPAHYTVWQVVHILNTPDAILTSAGSTAPKQFPHYKSPSPKRSPGSTPPPSSISRTTRSGTTATPSSTPSAHQRERQTS